MKTILLSTLYFFLFFLATELYGQTNFKWGKQFGSSSEDGSMNIKSDLSGNVYITGYTYGILSNKNYGKSDAFVTKLDSAGTVLWTNQFGTIEDDQISDLAIDKLGNVYVTGFTRGVLGDEKFGLEDVFVAKLDSTGVIKWKKQWGTVKRDVGNGISIDGIGDIYIAGETNGLFGDSICGITDGFVLKIDNEGNKKYIHQFGTIKVDNCNGIVVDSALNIYVSGSTFGSLGAKNNGQDDAFLAIFNDQMKPIRYIQIGSNSNDGYVHAALDKEGNIYLAGSTGGNFGGKQVGQGDCFLAKVNMQGETLWINQFGMDGWDGIHGIAINEKTSENIIVSGCQNWPSCQTFIRVFRNDGKLVGVHDFAIGQIGKGTCGRTSCIDNNGNIYNTGLTDEKLFNTVQGEHDIFVLKLALNTSLTNPYVNTSVESQTAYKDVQFSFTFPDTIFKSIGGTSKFIYSATTNNGNQLPTWLSFNAETRTFVGTPNATGTSYIKMIATDDSKAITSCVFSIVVKSKKVSIEDSPLNNIQIYPNPTNDKLEISFDKTPYKAALVKISNIAGKYIYINTFHKVKNATINLAGNPQGIYFVKIFIDGEMHTKEICLN